MCIPPPVTSAWRWAGSRFAPHMLPLTCAGLTTKTLLKPTSTGLDYLHLVTDVQITLHYLLEGKKEGRKGSVQRVRNRIQDFISSDLSMYRPYLGIYFILL